LFQAAGIKKKDLENPETAKFIYQTVGNAMAAQSQSQPGTMRNAPPPPPGGQGRTPPPPPPGGQGYMCFFCVFCLFVLFFCLYIENE